MVWLGAVLLAMTLLIGWVIFFSPRRAIEPRLITHQGVPFNASYGMMNCQTHPSRRSGIVEMATAKEAEAAIEKFNGHELDGRTLGVKHAMPDGLGGSTRSSGEGHRRSRW